MKTYLILFLSFYFIACATGQSIVDGGFTNKTEAKNKLKHGLKEGKWIEYINDSGKITTNSSAPFYILIVYKDDKPSEIARLYAVNGNLLIESPYSDGKLNGIQNIFTRESIKGNTLCKWRD